MLKRKKRPTKSRAEVIALRRATANDGVRRFTVCPPTQEQIEDMLERRERFARDVAVLVAASRQKDPALTAYFDGLVSAGEPKLLIAEVKILVRGLDEILERIHASMDIDEIDTLQALANLAVARIHEIRRAIDPLLAKPS